MKNGGARSYAVFGHPIAHSRSPWLHAYFARLTQRKIVYSAISPPLDGFDVAAADFFARGGCGINVTLPFKSAALAFADSASAFAERTGVANVLVRRRGVITACNTDSAGFLRALKEILPDGVAGKKVLLAGAGGAARAVAFALADENPAALLITNRTHARAEELATAVGAQVAKDYPSDAAVVINATAAGLTGEMPLPLSVFANAELAMDLSYGAPARDFLQCAKRSGAKQVADGAAMLAWQAAMSFAIWEGVMPSVSAVVPYLQAI